MRHPRLKYTSNRRDTDRANGGVGLCMSCLAVMIVLATVSSLNADVFDLTNGSQLEGTWTNSDETPLRRYVVDLSNGTRVILQKDQVHTIHRKPPALQSYQKSVRKMLDTVDAHWEMAERCGTAGLDVQRKYHLQRVLELEPDHEAGRRAMGYVRIRDQWVLPEEHFQKLGYVRHKGQWRLAQEIELEARKTQAEHEVSQWRQKIKRWRSSLGSNKPDDQQAALNGMRMIRSPYAAEPIAYWLAQPKEPLVLKKIYVEVLGNLLPTPIAVNALVQRTIEDSSQELTDMAIEQLKKQSTGYYLQGYLKELKSKDNMRINRAGYALGEIGDKSAIPALIEALTTKHRFVQTGPGMKTTFGSNGNGGLAAGRGSKITEITVQNKSVLAALGMMTPDNVRFGYDKSGWRSWYATVRVPAHYGLRRDR